MMRSVVANLVVLAVVAAVIAWRRMDPSQRTYLLSIARQVPELPGRYAV
jgi:hypothetical protein